MSKKSRRSHGRQPTPPTRPPARDWTAPPDLYELEKFSHQDLRRWQTASDKLDRLQLELYFGLESQRKASRADLLAALRLRPAPTISLDGWVRIVDYQYCLNPLSAAGSLRDIGGRFNVGQDIGIAGYETWPALYLAEDPETAYREKFQLTAGTLTSGLTPEELALQNLDGYLVAPVRGRIETTLDIGDSGCLKPFCDAIGKFKMPPKPRELARSLRIGAPRLIRSAHMLQYAALSPKWRVLPSQFDIPAVSQILGGLAKDAGYEAIVFRSSRNGRRCIAIFPTAFAASESFVEVAGGYPLEVQVARLDRSTWSRLVGNP